MKFSKRRAVSPIIASLLLIAIAVAAGIIVYVYVNSLAGNLTSGGGNQETQQMQLQSYAFLPTAASSGFISTGTLGTGQLVDVFLENVGSSSVTISAIYFDGNALTQWSSSSASYGQYLISPTGANCFAAIASTVAVTGNTAGGTATSSGTTTTCTPYNASGTVTCTAPNFCLNLTSTAGNWVQDLTVAPQGSVQLLVSLGSSATAGTSHTVKLVSATGGTEVFSVTAGRTG